MITNISQKKTTTYKKNLQEDRKQISDIRHRDIFLEKQLEGVKQKRQNKYYSYEKIIHDEAKKHGNVDRENGTTKEENGQNVQS